MIFPGSMMGLFLILSPVPVFQEDCANLAGNWSMSEIASLRRTLTIAGSSETFNDPLSPGSVAVTAGTGVSRSATSSAPWIAITSGSRGTGSGAVVFGDQERSAYSSALPLVPQFPKSVVFSQVASDASYFTGVAILNPDDAGLTATVEAFERSGPARSHRRWVARAESECQGRPAPLCGGAEAQDSRRRRPVRAGRDCRALAS